MWLEVETAYAGSHRHYHNLTHLDALCMELESHRQSFVSWDAVIFAIAYHDLVYNTLKSNNEEKSAATAVARLTKIAPPESLISACERFILATKRHEASDGETNLFTDADLSILGTDIDTYKEYAKKIRREYSIYPDIVYNPGRKKVLKHFLRMEKIFKTDAFFEKYELSARRNLQSELDSL